MSKIIGITVGTPINPEKIGDISTVLEEAQAAVSSAQHYAHEASRSAKEAADAVDAKMGDVESALDAIIAIQESLIGGEAV